MTPIEIIDALIAFNSHVFHARQANITKLQPDIDAARKIEATDAEYLASVKGMALDYAECRCNMCANFSPEENAAIARLKAEAEAEVEVSEPDYISYAQEACDAVMEVYQFSHDPSYYSEQIKDWDKANKSFVDKLLDIRVSKNTKQPLAAETRDGANNLPAESNDAQSPEATTPPQRRFLCERCGGTGQQPAGCWTGNAYDSVAGKCESCDGDGELGLVESSKQPLAADTQSREATSRESARPVPGTQSPEATTPALRLPKRDCELGLFDNACYRWKSAIARIQMRGHESEWMDSYFQTENLGDSCQDNQWFIDRLTAKADEQEAEDAAKQSRESAVFKEWQALPRRHINARKCANCGKAYDKHFGMSCEPKAGSGEFYPVALDAKPVPNPGPDATEKPQLIDGWNPGIIHLCAAEDGVARRIIDGIVEYAVGSEWILSRTYYDPHPAGMDQRVNAWIRAHKPDGIYRELQSKEESEEDACEPTEPYGDREAEAYEAANKSDFINGIVKAVVTACFGCGNPMLNENAWMEDGCLCNTHKGINCRNPARVAQLEQYARDIKEQANKDVAEIKIQLATAYQKEAESCDKALADLVRKIATETEPDGTRGCIISSADMDVCLMAQLQACGMFAIDENAYGYGLVKRSYVKPVPNLAPATVVEDKPIGYLAGLRATDKARRDAENDCPCGEGECEECATDSAKPESHQLNKPTPKFPHAEWGQPGVEFVVDSDIGSISVFAKDGKYDSWHGGIIEVLWRSFDEYCHDLRGYPEVVAAVRKHAEGRKQAADERPAVADVKPVISSFSTMNLERCTSPQGFNRSLDSWSLSDWMVALGGEVGEAMNVVNKLNRIRDGIPANKEHETEEYLKTELADELSDAFIYLDLIFQAVGIDQMQAVVAKFNKTSEKINWPKIEHISSPGEAVAVSPAVASIKPWDAKPRWPRSDGQFVGRNSKWDFWLLADGTCDIKDRHNILAITSRPTLEDADKGGQPWPECAAACQAYIAAHPAEYATDVKSSLETETQAYLEASELYLMQMTAITTAGMQNTLDSRKNRIGKGNQYYSVGYQEMCRVVDREIVVRQNLEIAQSQLTAANERIAELEKQLESANEMLDGNRREVSRLYEQVGSVIAERNEARGELTEAKRQCDVSKNFLEQRTEQVRVLEYELRQAKAALAERKPTPEQIVEGFCCLVDASPFGFTLTANKLDATPASILAALQPTDREKAIARLKKWVAIDAQTRDQISPTDEFWGDVRDALAALKVQVAS